MNDPIRRRLLPLALMTACAAPAMAADWPAGYSKCADEGEACKVGNAPRSVSYGIKGKWVLKTLSGTIACGNTTFGDPYPGKAKKCAVAAGTVTPPPPPPPPGGGDAATEAAPASGWAGQAGGTTGGAAARGTAVYTVSSASQLLNALKAQAGQPALVKVNGTIDMAGADNGGPFKDHDDQAARNAIKLPSNTTLIGAGGGAQVLNARIEIKGVENVIVRNLRIVNPCDLEPTPEGKTSWNAAFDGIEVNGSRHVWIDHNLFTDAPFTDDKAQLVNGHPKKCHDGALDIKRASDYVTVSNNVFELHDKNTLVGHDDDVPSDEGHLTVTFDHNHFRHLTQRAPRVRYGKVHAYNNYYEGDRAHPVYPHSYSIGVGMKAKVISEANVFDVAGAESCAQLVKPMGDAPGAFVDKGSLLGGRVLDASACKLSSNVGWSVPYAYQPLPAAQVREQVLRNAGVGKIRVQ